VQARGRCDCLLYGARTLPPWRVTAREPQLVRSNVAGYTSEVKAYPATSAGECYLIRTTWPPVGHNCGPMPLAGAMLQFET
jgi:hypothetical protein